MYIGQAGIRKNGEGVLFRVAEHLKDEFYFTDEGFVVLAGSQIEETDAEAIPDTIKKLRARCRQNNEIKDGVLTKNYLFKSPSYAASFILGMTTNGKTDWKTADGVSLKTR